MYLHLKCNSKGGTQNTNFKVINQHKNDMCHVQSLGKDFTLMPLVLLTVFSPTNKIIVYWAKPPFNKSLLQKFNTCINQICLVECE
jgi:hypothetical protein